MIEPTLIPAPFPQYDVAGVGTVVAHEDGSYVVRMDDGRVCGFPAPNGTPSAESAVADIAAALANPVVPAAPPVVLSPLTIRSRLTLSEKIALDTSTDPLVIVVRNDLIAAGEVRSDDPRTALGKQILIDRGVISAERAAEIYA